MAGTLSDDITPEGLRRAADLFYSLYPEGQSIILEDIHGDLHVGKLSRDRYDDYLIMKSGRKTVEIDWKDIVFVAHDGFPVRAIARMAPEEADTLAQDFDTALARNTILRLLQDDEQRHLEALKEERVQERAEKYRRERERDEEKSRIRRWVNFGGGCPFTFENVEVLALNNPGQNGHRWWGKGNEEELVLRAGDGAMCLSYDLGHLFYMETGELQIGHAP